MQMISKMMDTSVVGHDDAALAKSLKNPEPVHAQGLGGLATRAFKFVVQEAEITYRCRP